MWRVKSTNSSLVESYELDDFVNLTGIVCPNLRDSLYTSQGYQEARCLQGHKTDEGIFFLCYEFSLYRCSILQGIIRCYKYNN